MEKTKLDKLESVVGDITDKVLDMSEDVDTVLRLLRTINSLLSKERMKSIRLKNEAK